MRRSKWLLRWSNKDGPQRLVDIAITCHNEKVSPGLSSCRYEISKHTSYDSMELRYLINRLEELGIDKFMKIYKNNDKKNS